MQESRVFDKESTNYMYFIEDEIAPNGTRCKQPLYIMVKCKYCMVAKVMKDNGSTINMMSRYVLNQMLINVSHIKISIMIRAYDGTPRFMIRNINIELLISP